MHIFGSAVYFLFDGLRHTGVSDAAKGYVFPGLHNIRKDGVAGRLTRNIQSILKPIFGDEVAKQTTSRSTRKGAMTENRDNRDLTTQEEYARSGHTASDMNPNAEGYIESTPAMNAPAGRALAGIMIHMLTVLRSVLDVSMTVLPLPLTDSYSNCLQMMFFNCKRIICCILWC